MKANNRGVTVVYVIYIQEAYVHIKIIRSHPYHALP